MHVSSVLCAAALVSLLFLAAFLFWRRVWLFRNPRRTTPPGRSFVSPADGRVVYVKILRPGDDVVIIKQGVSATINDILREDVALPRLLIGIFMSPFDVHYNRAPSSGTIESIRHYPAVEKNVNMRTMHLRTLFRFPPYYKDSMHIIENERTVTRIGTRCNGRRISCYVVQIAGGHVSGIDSYMSEGDEVQRGAIFGMIRIGSQVDLILPYLSGFRAVVREGDRVRAGESILVGCDDDPKLSKGQEEGPGT